MARSTGKLIANLRTGVPLTTFNDVILYLRQIEGDTLEHMGVNSETTEMRVRTDGDSAVIGLAFYDVAEAATDGG